MGQQKGNPTPSYQNQAYEALRPNTGARAGRDMGTKPVMIDDTKTLDELIDSGSQLFTQGYAKDSDLIDGTINARFDTLTANEYHITILSSSVLYANGSNKFGDTADDRHEFTGSILVGGDVLGNARLNQATASLNAKTGSYAVTGSNTFYETQTISGSFNVSGSTIQSGNNTLTGNTVLSGSINISGSTTFNGVHTLSGSNTIVGNTLMIGTNTIIGNTFMSGSIEVSGSSNFHNSIFIVSGSSYFTGSHFVNGNSVFSGSINIASGSSYYRAGNKLFNYGQWGSLETQSGSANTAYPMKLNMQFDGAEGVYVANNGSGFPTRLTVENTGLYNIQFSAQLHATTTTAIDFSIWFAMTGSNIENSNTDFSIEKFSGGGFSVAALNLLTPITAGDYVELYWSTTHNNGQLQYKAAQSTPTRPATPSIIVTITQVA